MCRPGAWVIRGPRISKSQQMSFWGYKFLPLHKPPATAKPVLTHRRELCASYICSASLISVSGAAYLNPVKFALSAGKCLLI